MIKRKTSSRNVLIKQQNFRDKEKNINLLLNAKELQLPWDTISHIQKPTRLRHPWDSPGKNTGVGCISFSNAWKWKVKMKSFSRVGLIATPWSAAYQAPPSMGFSRQEYWSGVPVPSPIYHSSKTQMFGTVLCWEGWPQISLLRMQNNRNPWKGIWPHQTKFYMHMFLDPATLLEEAALKDTFIKLLKGFTQSYLLKN